jgi:hypothetical protein
LIPDRHLRRSLSGQITGQLQNILSRFPRGHKGEHHMKELLRALPGGAQNGDAQYCSRQVLGMSSVLPAAPHVPGKNGSQFLPQPAGGRELCEVPVPSVKT